jgi:hypothetical protein
VPSGTVGLGVYNGAPSETPDEHTQSEFGSAPAVASTYYQTTNKLNQTYEGARMKRGTSPNIAITTKGTQYLAGIASGDPTAIAWLDNWVSQLKQLAAVNPKIPVYATLDQEYRVKVRLGQITGESANPDVYGRALVVFWKKLHAAAPNLKGTYWFVGYDRAFEGEVGTQFTTKPDAILWDPYANTGSDTVTSICKADVDWIKAQPWYVGQTLALAEFGMPVSLGDTALGNFFTNVRGQLDALGIDWAVLFNRSKDNDNQIAGRTDGQTFPKAVNAFSNSM